MKLETYRPGPWSLVPGPCPIALVPVALVPIALVPIALVPIAVARCLVSRIMAQGSPAPIQATKTAEACHFLTIRADRGDWRRLRPCFA